MGLKRSRQDSVSSSEHTSSPSETFEEQPLNVKIVQLDTDEAISDRPAVMKCSLPPHPPMEFASFQDYDVHYQKSHLNRCSECNNNFPDQHFLHLHISENHDPIRAAKADQGEKTVRACVHSLCSLNPKCLLYMWLIHIVSLLVLFQIATGTISFLSPLTLH